MADKLTIKQEKYAQGLWAGLSQREAYRQAFPTSKNWKDETVDSKACILAKDEKVMARLAELTNKLTERSLITVEQIVNQLGKIAFSDITEFATFGQKEVIMRGSPANINYVDFKESAEVDGTIIQEVKQGKDGSSVKLNDRMKALELLGRYLGMFTDNVNHSGTVEVKVVDDIPDD